jgi:hypothetical protein
VTAGGAYINKAPAGRERGVRFVAAANLKRSALLGSSRETEATASAVFRHFQRGRDIHAPLERAGDGAKIGVESENALGNLTPFRIDLQPIPDMNSSDDEHLSIQLDFPGCLG